MVAGQPESQNRTKMKQSPITALIITTWLAGVAWGVEGQQAETPAARNAATVSDDPQTAPAARASSTIGLSWLTDLAQAQARAKAEGKSVLLFFHGSDWCAACAEMQGQVFDSPEFARYARRALVLVDVDFPEKEKQNEELKRANLALKARFNLGPGSGDGFPTLVLLNGAGETVYQETGYAGGGAAEVLARLQRHTGTFRPISITAAFKNLGVDEFAQMAADKRNVILDVRTAREFEAGHLPGAMNLDVNAADFEAKAAALDKSKTYLVHCASGVRSVKACEKLVRLDFAKLYNLPGGFKAWAQAGKPVEK
jgi:rhodanese-related sulfurtransferase